MWGIASIVSPKIGLRSDRRGTGVAAAVNDFAKRGALGSTGEAGRPYRPGPIRAKKMSVGPSLASGPAMVKIAAKP